MLRSRGKAKRSCRSCPVRYECLADALDNRIEFGVWGGMTERERRALLRRHPQVTSWRKMFEAAMKKNAKEKQKMENRMREMEKEARREMERVQAEFDRQIKELESKLRNVINESKAEREVLVQKIRVLESKREEAKERGCCAVM